MMMPNATSLGQSQSVLRNGGKSIVAMLVTVSASSAALKSRWNHVWLSDVRHLPPKQPREITTLAIMAIGYISMPVSTWYLRSQGTTFSISRNSEHTRNATKMHSLSEKIAERALSRE